MSVLEDDDLLGEEKMSGEIKNTLVNTSKWAIFIGVSHIVVMLVLVSFIAYLYSVTLSGRNVSLSILFIPQLILLVLLIIYCIVMVMYGVKFIKAVRENNQILFESGIRLFKMWMILSACFLLMLLLIFLYTFRN